MMSCFAYAQELWNERSADLVAPLIGPARLAAFKEFILAGKPPKVQRGERQEHRQYITDVSIFTSSPS